MKISKKQKSAKNIDSMLEIINNQMETDKQLSAIGLRYINDKLDEYKNEELDELDGNRLDFMEIILNKAKYYHNRSHLKLVG